MAEQASESKSSVKNKKRRSNKARKQEEGFEITTDVPVDSASYQQTLDPVSVLKNRIEEAKAAKDFKQAQKLREQLWTLRDNTALGGSIGPNIPDRVSDHVSSLVEPDESQAVSQTVVPPPQTDIPPPTDVPPPQTDIPPPTDVPPPQTDVPSADHVLNDSPAAKSLHKLEKKLRAIEELKEKRNQGTKLEANQRAKIATEDEVRKDIQLLRDMLTKGSNV